MPTKVKISGVKGQSGGLKNKTKQNKTKEAATTTKIMLVAIAPRRSH